DPLPVLLERVVALDDGLKLEALRSVADLLSLQLPNAPVDVLARDAWLDLFDPQKILLVKRTEALHSRFEFVDGQVELLGIQVSSFLTARPADCQSRPVLSRH